VVGRRVVANFGPTLVLIFTSLLPAWRLGMARSRVELFEQIRRDRRTGGSSIRELADRHHVHRRTVRQALASAVPPPRKAYLQRPRPAIDRYAGLIDGWLLADREASRKQRHTARRIWQRLVAEHGATLAEVTVSRYVARRRAELGLDRVEVAVPQEHQPGAEAEVDFGEFHAVIAGVLLKLWMFVLRLSCSGRAFHVAFATQAQEAFLDPSWLNLVCRLAGLADRMEGLAQVVGEGVGGGDGVRPGLDLDGAVAAGGLDEFADGPAGLVLDPAADRQGGEDDGQVCFDRVSGAVVDGPGLQVAFGHPE